LAGPVSKPDVRGAKLVEKGSLEGFDLEPPGKLIIERGLKLLADAVPSHLRSGEGKEEDDPGQYDVDAGPQEGPGDARSRTGRRFGHERGDSLGRRAFESE